MADDSQVEQPFFIYDHSVLKKEEDDLKDAIIYYYPPMTSIDDRCALCGQLMGMITFFVSLTGAPPSIYRLHRSKVAVRHQGRFTLALGGDRRLPDRLLLAQLDFLYRLFTFYHRNINDLTELCQRQKRNFIDYLGIIWDTYIPYARYYGDDFLSALQPVPTLQLTRGQSSLFLRATHLLEACQRAPGVLAGCLLVRNKVLCTQLTPAFTSRLLLLRPQQTHLPCRAINTDFTLPVGVKLLAVYLTEEEVMALYPSWDKQETEEESTPSGNDGSDNPLGISSQDMESTSCEAKESDDTLSFVSIDGKTPRSSPDHLETKMTQTPHGLQSHTQIDNTKPHPLVEPEEKDSSGVPEHDAVHSKSGPTDSSDTLDLSYLDNFAGSVSETVLETALVALSNAYQGISVKPQSEVLEVSENTVINQSETKDNQDACKVLSRACEIQTDTRQSNSIEVFAAKIVQSVIAKAMSRMAASREERLESITVLNNYDGIRPDEKSEFVQNRIQGIPDESTEHTTVNALADELLQSAVDEAMPCIVEDIEQSMQRNTNKDEVFRMKNTEKISSLNHQSEKTQENSIKAVNVESLASQMTESIVQDATTYLNSTGDFYDADRSCRNNSEDVMCNESSEYETKSMDNFVSKMAQSIVDNVTHTVGGVDSGCNINSNQEGIKRRKGQHEEYLVGKTNSKADDVAGKSYNLERDGSPDDITSSRQKSEHLSGKDKKAIERVQSTPGAQCENQVQYERNELDDQIEKPGRESGAVQSLQAVSDGRDSLPSVETDIHVDGNCEKLIRETDVKRPKSKSAMTIQKNDLKCNITSHGPTLPDTVPLTPPSPATKTDLFKAVKQVSKLAAKNYEAMTTGDVVQEGSPHRPASRRSSQTSEADSVKSAAPTTESPMKRIVELTKPLVALKQSRKMHKTSSTTTRNRSSSLNEADPHPKTAPVKAGGSQQGKPQKSRKKFKKGADGLHEMDLYIQGNADLLLLMMMEGGASQEKDAVQKLWKLVLPELGEMDIYLKQRVGGDHQTTKQELEHNYLLFDKEQKTLKGNKMQPVTASEHNFCSTAVTMHDDFCSSDTLTDIILRSYQSHVYGHRAAGQETFFQLHGSARTTAGFPNERDTNMAADAIAYQKMMSVEQALII